MLKGRHIRMNVSERPDHVYYGFLRLCNIFALLSKIVSSNAAVFLMPESFPIVGFEPHVDTTEVFGKAH